MKTAEQALKRIEFLFENNDSALKVMEAAADQLYPKEGMAHEICMSSAKGLHHVNWTHLSELRDFLTALAKKEVM